MRPPRHSDGRSAWFRYGVAALITALAFALRLMILPEPEPITYVVALPAISLIASLAGFGPAFAATLVSAGIIQWLLLRRFEGGVLPGRAALINQGLYLIGATLTSWLINALMKERAKLARREAQLRSILNYSTAAIFVKDPEGRYLAIGERAVRRMGLSAAQFIGHTDFDVFPAEVAERVRSTDKKVAATAQPLELEEKIPVKGADRTFLTLKFPLFDSSGRAYATAGIATDITERVRAEDERKDALLRERASRRLAEERLSKIRDEKELRERFVALLTHDLRNPLSAIRSSAQLLLSKGLQRERIAASIVNAADRMDRMLRDLLDVHRIRAGQPLTLDMKSCNAYEIASQVAEEMNLVYGNRVTVQGERRAQGVWSADGLTRMIENLVANALKYGDHDAPVTVSISQERSMLRLSVHNQGAPIPPENLSRLFEPFSQYPVSSTRRDGWGLGLTLVRGMIEAHGGTISVQSSAAEGTTFTAELPREAPSQAPVLQRLGS